MTAAGPNHIAFVIGPDPHETIAIADTANGRIIGRIAPGKGAILSLAASPDGAAIYFAAGGSVWSVASTGGDAHRISAGDGVVADPAGRELVVVRKDSSRILLFRMPVNGGPEQAVPLDSAARVYYMVVSPGTMRGDGRMLLSLNILDSWFNPLALLDMTSGRVTRLAGDGVSDLHSSAWMPDGKIVTIRQGLNATIWKFTPEGP
jgi:hypothetical protein